MKHSLLEKGRKALFMILVSLTGTTGVFAQNSSYGSNNIPINGTYCCAFGVGALQMNMGANNTAN